MGLLNHGGGVLAMFRFRLSLEASPEPCADRPLTYPDPTKAPRPDFSRYPDEHPRIGRCGRDAAAPRTCPLPCKNTDLGADGLAGADMAQALPLHLDERRGS